MIGYEFPLSKIDILEQALRLVPAPELLASLARQPQGPTQFYRDGSCWQDWQRRTDDEQ